MGFFGLSACRIVTDTPWSPRHPWPPAFTPLLHHLSQVTPTPSIDPPFQVPQDSPGACAFLSKCDNVTEFLIIGQAYHLPRDTQKSIKLCWHCVAIVIQLPYQNRKGDSHEPATPDTQTHSRRCPRDSGKPWSGDR